MSFNLGVCYTIYCADNEEFLHLKRDVLNLILFWETGIPASRTNYFISQYLASVIELEVEVCALTSLVEVRKDAG